MVSFHFQREPSSLPSLAEHQIFEMRFTVIQGTHRLLPPGNRRKDPLMDSRLLANWGFNPLYLGCQYKDEWIRDITNLE